MSSETRWFWFKESLLDDRPDVPLGKLDPDGTWTWAPGEPKPRHAFTDEVLVRFPGLVARLFQHRWTDPRINITEGEPWGPPDTTPPSAHPLDGVTSFADLAARVGPVPTGLLAGAPPSPCPDCGEPVRRGLGCFCRPGETT